MSKRKLLLRESWKGIKGYEGKYQISSLGRVRSVGRCVQVSTKKRTYTMYLQERILSPEIGSGGYHHVGLCLDGKGKTFRVHRLVLETFVGPCPKGKEARHKNGDPSKNALYNLAWGTKKENGLDKRRHGTVKGINSKLTQDDVRRIRNDTRTTLEIARTYGLSQPSISSIKHRRTWAHVV